MLHTPFPEKGEAACSTIASKKLAHGMSLTQRVTASLAEVRLARFGVNL